MNRRPRSDSFRIAVLRISMLFVAVCIHSSAVAGDPITAIALAPGGESAITGSQAGLFQLSGTQFENVRRLPCEIESIHDVQFSPDGKRLAVAGGTPGQFGLTEILDWPGTMVVARIRQHDDVVYSVRWSSDGQCLASASLDGACLVCDSVSAMPLQKITGHSKAVTGVEWLASGMSDDAERPSLIITCSLDQTIRVWSIDIENTESAPRLVRTMDQHTGAIMGISLLSKVDNQSRPVLASWGDDRTVRFWQPDNGRLLRFARLPSVVTSAVWSTDGSELFATMESGVIAKIFLSTARVTEIGRADKPTTAIAPGRQPAKLISGDSAGAFTEISIPQ